MKISSCLSVATALLFVATVLPSAQAVETTAPPNTPSTSAQPSPASSANVATPTPISTASPNSAQSSVALPSATPSSKPAETPVKAVAATADNGAIAARYRADGGEQGAFYGKPTSETKCGYALGSCYQEFDRGTIVWSPTTGARLLIGGVRQKWYASGGINSSYGIPTTEETSNTTRNAVEQRFITGSGRQGALYWSNKTGTNFVDFAGGIGGTWRRGGAFPAPNTYGLPTSPEQCGFPNGACFQRFEKGTLVWTPQNGIVHIGGEIRNQWERSGGMNSNLGVPLTNEISRANGGVEQRFITPSGRSGSYFWTPSTGAQYVYFSGGIGGYWVKNGSYVGTGIDTPLKYGFPTTNEICSNGTCYQKFQYGIITWTPAQGVRGMEAQKCIALNNGRSKYSTQGAPRVALAMTQRYSNYRKDPGGYQGMFYSCKNVYGTYVLDWKTQAAFGENGFLAPNRQIRDQGTYGTGELLPPGVTGNTEGAYNPTGSFGFSNPFGISNPGSGFSGYHTLNSASRWGGDRNTWYYNKYVENARLGLPNENMWYFANRGDYRQGVLINYNKNPDGSTPSGNAGFAIMLHTIPYGAGVYDLPTWGCVAIPPERMAQFLREGGDSDRIIMGVESTIMNW